VLFCAIFVGFEVVQPIPGGLALLYYSLPIKNNKTPSIEITKILVKNE
jgi:hypothetical protein